MLRIAICDDEPICLEHERQIIIDYLQECKEECVVDCFTSAQDLLLSRTIKDCDLVMLDVEMPGMGGIEAAAKVHEINDKALIAFISAYMKYASSGYHVNAIRYILKNDEIDKYIKECLEQILKIYGIDNRTVTFEFSIGERKLKVMNILYIKSQSNYTVFVTNDIEILKQKRPIKRVTEDMAKYGFVSVNSGESVNLRRVKEVRGNSVILDNDKALHISHRKYNDFINALRLLERGKNL